MKKITIWVLALGVLLLAGWFGWQGWQARRSANQPDAGGLPTLTVYTSRDMTTPQLAFWAAVKDGSVGRLFNIDLREWRDNAQFQNIVLAG